MRMIGKDRQIYRYKESERERLKEKSGKVQEREENGGKSECDN